MYLCTYFNFIIIRLRTFPAKCHLTNNYEMNLMFTRDFDQLIISGDCFLSSKLPRFHRLVLTRFELCPGFRILLLCNSPQRNHQGNHILLSTSCNCLWSETRCCLGFVCTSLATRNHLDATKLYCGLL